MSKNKTILIVDDDLFLMMGLIDMLVKAGYTVVTAETGEKGLNQVRKRKGKIDVVVLDMMMRYGRNSKNLDLERVTGLSIARTIKREFPYVKLIGLSVLGDESVVNWFKEYGDGYLRKPARPSQLLDTIHYAIHGKPRRKPKCFIVHGHDEMLLSDLKFFLQKDLHIDDVIILREQPNFGRTLVEKFEDFAKDIDIAFIILTPDDVAYSEKVPNNKKRRARQNVIFELGYFYAQLQRLKGRVILLYKGDLDLPSDISGIVYIDITKGVKASSDLILRELSDWF